MGFLQISTENSAFEYVNLKNFMPLRTQSSVLHAYNSYETPVKSKINPFSQAPNLPWLKMKVIYIEYMCL